MREADDEAGTQAKQRSFAGRGEFERFLRVLRRRLGLIVLCVLAVTGSAVGFSLIQEKKYSATADLLFRDAQLDQKLFGSTVLPPSTDPAREAATNLKLVSLEVIAGRAARAIGGGISASSVQGKVNVSTEGQANVVSITVTDEHPPLAAKLANIFAREFITFRRDADRTKIAAAEQLVQNQIDRLSSQERGGVRGRSLQDRAEQLGILASLQTGNAELVQPAKVPSSPSSPKVKQNGALGLLLGLILGVGLAFMFERLDRRMKGIGELEDTYGLPVLGTVPDSPALGSSPLSAPEFPFAVTEAFRMLRARLRYFNVDRPLRSLLITSVGPGEGKTTIAQHLAIAAASGSSSRVLLLEADLRRPQIAGEYGLEPMPGLSEVLTHGVALEDVVQHLGIAETGSSTVNGKTLDVIVAGANPPNSAELLDSATMADLLKDLSSAYDLLIIDTPPTSVVADAIPLMSQVSGVIVISQVGRSSRDAAAHLREQLRRLAAPTLGVVANRVKVTRGDSYYGYYGYRNPDVPARGTETVMEEERTKS